MWCVDNGVHLNSPGIHFLWCDPIIVCINENIKTNQNFRMTGYIFKNFQLNDILNASYFQLLLFIVFFLTRKPSGCAWWEPVSGERCYLKSMLLAKCQVCEKWGGNGWWRYQATLQALPSCSVQVCRAWAVGWRLTVCAQVCLTRFSSVNAPSQRPRYWFTE